MTPQSNEFQVTFPPKTHQVNLSSPTLIIPFSDLNTPPGMQFLLKQVYVKCGKDI